MLAVVLATLMSATPSQAIERPHASVVLYASVEDWRASRPAHRQVLSVQEVGWIERIQTDDVLRGFVAFDLDRSVARAIGPVAMVAVGDQVFYNESAPKPPRGQSYGPLHVTGDQALYARHACTWVYDGPSGNRVCWNDIRTLDLDTMKHDTVTRRSLDKALRDHPDLLQSWQEKRRRDPSARWRATSALLSRTEDAAERIHAPQTE